MFSNHEFYYLFLQKNIKKDCNYRSWIDAEMCNRFKQIIAGLLCKIHRYDGEIENLKQLVKKHDVKLENCVCCVAKCFLVLKTI